MAPDAKNDDGLLSRHICRGHTEEKKCRGCSLRLLLKKHKKIQGLRLKGYEECPYPFRYTVSRIPMGEFCGYRTDIRFEAEKGKLRILC